jgi:hypothetical protein
LLNQIKLSITEVQILEPKVPSLCNIVHWSSLGSQAIVRACPFKCIHYTIEEASSFIRKICKSTLSTFTAALFICSKVSNPAAEAPVSMLQWLVFGTIYLACFWVYVAFKLWFGFLVSVRMHFITT